MNLLLRWLTLGYLLQQELTVCPHLLEALLNEFWLTEQSLFARPLKEGRRRMFLHSLIQRMEQQ